MPILFVGTYTKGTAGEGIYTLEYNDTLQKLSILSTQKSQNPSFLACYGNTIYAANELETTAGASAYRIQEDYSLLPIGSISAAGSASCHIAVNRKALYVANYGSGSLLCCTRKQDGSMDEPSCVIQHRGGASPHAHSVVFSLDQSYLLVADLGLDRIYCYQIRQDGSLISNAAQPYIELPKGEGPRHMVFHPNGQILYVVSELAQNVLAFSFALETGNLALSQKLALFADPLKESAAADIHISPKADYLYASNRGNNTISIFGINNNGGLTYVGYSPSHGRWPRNFAIDPDGKYIVVAGEHSNNLSVCALDQKSGAISSPLCSISVSCPCEYRNLSK